MVSSSVIDTMNTRIKGMRQNRVNRVRNRIFAILNIRLPIAIFSTIGILRFFLLEYGPFGVESPYETIG